MERVTAERGLDQLSRGDVEALKLHFDEDVHPGSLAREINRIENAGYKTLDLASRAEKNFKYGDGPQESRGAEAIHDT